MTIAELINAIFETQVPFWQDQFEEWVRSSRRFRAFAETYRDKIRKKLRNVRDDAGKSHAADCGPEDITVCFTGAIDFLARS